MDDILSVLRDPAARTLLTVVGLLTAVATFFLGQWWWKRKTLSYAIDKTRILRIHDDVAKDRVQITLDGSPVEDVSLVIVTIANTGHESIREGDFAGPLRVILGEEAQILSFEIINPRPRDLTPIVKADGKTLLLEPVLLNRGDLFKLKALVNKVGDARVSGRISGVAEIRKGLFEPLGIAGVSAVVVGVLLVSVGEFLDPRPPLPPRLQALMVAGMVLAYGGLFIVTVRRIKSIRRKWKM